MDGRKLTQNTKAMNKYQIRLTISCFNLKKHKKSGLFHKMNPQAVIMKKLPGGTWASIGKTETIKGINNPIFFKQLYLDQSYCTLTQEMLRAYGGLRKQEDLNKYDLRITILDNRKKKSFVIGETPLFFDGVNEANQKRFSYELVSFENDKNNPEVTGTLLINTDVIVGNSNYFMNQSFTLGARNIKNTEFFGFTDPFLIFYRPDEMFIASGDYRKIPEAKWTMILKTKHIKDSLNPQFDNWTDYADNICRSFPECWLKVEIWDYSNKNQHKYVSRAFFQYKQMLVQDSFFKLDTFDERKKFSGRVVIQKVKNEILEVEPEVSSPGFKP